MSGVSERIARYEQENEVLSSQVKELRSLLRDRENIERRWRHAVAMGRGVQVLLKGGKRREAFELWQSLGGSPMGFYYFEEVGV
jgi:hypothetical protein